MPAAAMVGGWDFGRVLGTHGNVGGDDRSDVVVKDTQARHVVAGVLEMILELWELLQGRIQQLIHL